MNEESLRAILRDPSYPRELRETAFRLLVRDIPRARLIEAFQAVRRLDGTLYAGEKVVQSGMHLKW